MDGNSNYFFELLPKRSLALTGTGAFTGHPLELSADDRAKDGWTARRRSFPKQ